MQRHRLSLSCVCLKQYILTYGNRFYKDFDVEFTICSADEHSLTDAWKGGKLTHNQTDGCGTGMLQKMTHNEAGTEAFGSELAGKLQVPTVICMYGELGAGKTAFVRGLASGLGITAAVSSPTFTIVNEYPGKPELIHFDMYRLHGADELFDIGWEDYLQRNAVLVIEWSENVEEAFDGSEISVHIQKLSETDRLITVEGDALC